MGVSEKILDFYRNNDHLLASGSTLQYKSKDNPFEGKADNALFINSNQGLGDTLSVFHLPKFFKKYDLESYIGAHPSNKYLKSLQQFSPDFVEGMTESGGRTLIKENIENKNRVEIIQAYYDDGKGGHFFQKIQRALGFEVDVRPKPDLFAPHIGRVKNKVAMNYKAGACADAEQRAVHPRARQLYPEHRETIQKFINDNQHKYHFVEISTESTGWENVEDRCGLPLEKSIEEVASCEYYLGLHTGVMHLAAAFDLKSIVILNFPSPKRLYLPLLKPYQIVDGDWLYPQNVHLHEDEDGELCRILTYENLEKAFGGEIYPFFSDRYLELIK